MPQLPGALGVFSAEGGQFLSGHGFTPEKKLATVASFSGLWDGSGFRRLRAGDGLIDLPGRRLAAHLMIQVDAASAVLSDPVLRDQGFLARFLIAAPETLAGERLWKEPSDQIEPAIRRYAGNLLWLFEAPIKAANALGNELTPRVLDLSEEAKEAWILFYNDVERDMKAGRQFYRLRDFASKAAEQAARVAGVLAIVDARETLEIDGDAMLRACEIVGWHLSEAVRMMTAARVSPELADAKTLLAWLHERGSDQISTTELQKIGPNALRAKERLDPAIRVLFERGWLTRDGASPKSFRVASENRN